MNSPPIGFPALLQTFFQRRLVAERGASAQTIASYRDTFELLLRYAEQSTGRSPSALTLNDLDAPLILAFLDHLETNRGNCPRTRNLRLTAVRSFMQYVSVRDPTALPIAQRVLAIPGKRFDRPALEFLSREEVKALLDAPDRSTWSGRRDAVLLATLYNTGARVSEITGLCVTDVLTDRASALHLHGKGRKERVIPLWKTTAKQLRAWLSHIDSSPGTPVFSNRAGARLSRSGVQYRLSVALATATNSCPSLAGRRISPHTLRQYVDLGNMGSENLFLFYYNKLSLEHFPYYLLQHNLLNHSIRSSLSSHFGKPQGNRSEYEASKATRFFSVSALA